MFMQWMRRTQFLNAILIVCVTVVSAVLALPSMMLLQNDQEFREAKFISMCRLLAKFFSTGWAIQH